ncbi:hypothetical protein HV053_26285 (plasmid) [Klebsiella pneumoniae]|nr:hypothetical protein [Klebsiella pneumoniae]MBA8104108.1 hypothetical protein [Klebsiella pneumoniae]QMA10552.1 hypothetical protein HV051_26220 [Klebsiella pneumoniae]QMA15784.1 hypothetical protein HV049_26215 [Klebsiella pneumoniae]
MAHDVPLGCAPDEYDDLISGTCSHLPYIKSLSGNTKGMVLYGRVKEELIRRGVIAVYEKTVVWR